MAESRMRMYPVRLMFHPQAHHHRAGRGTQPEPSLDPLLNTRRLTVQTHHNTIPRLRRPTPRVGLSSFTACSSCPCRQLWNAYANPASFCLQRPRSSPLCLSARLYSQIMVRGRDSEPDGKPPPRQPMEASWKRRKDNCRQCRCTLIAVCPYTSNRFVCSGKTPTVH